MECLRDGGKGSVKHLRSKKHGKFQDREPELVRWEIRGDGVLLPSRWKLLASISYLRLKSILILVDRREMMLNTYIKEEETGNSVANLPNP